MLSAGQVITAPASIGPPLAPALTAVGVGAWNALSAGCIEEERRIIEALVAAIGILRAQRAALPAARHARAASIKTQPICAGSALAVAPRCAFTAVRLGALQM